VRSYALARKYREFTMIPPALYADNLRQVYEVARVPGCVVECGVWRGGMIAGIAEVLGPSRHYHLFDSFEGLPPAQPIDGPAALHYQEATDSPHYLDNCAAEVSFAQRAMAKSGASAVTYHRGWFKDTLPGFQPAEGIAVLRLDGDWYESTKQCLDVLYPQVVAGGLILIDDYYTWDGCARAVHDYLAERQEPDRIHETAAGVCYLWRSQALERHNRSCTSS
jgi:O-methyltransferase